MDGRDDNNLFSNFRVSNAILISEAVPGKAGKS